DEAVSTGALSVPRLLRAAAPLPEPAVRAGGAAPNTVFPWGKTPRFQGLPGLSQPKSGGTSLVSEENWTVSGDFPRGNACLAYCCLPERCLTLSRKFPPSARSHRFDPGQGESRWPQGG